MIQTPWPIRPAAIAAQPKTKAKRTGWQVSATAIAVATLMGLWTPDASALALGRVKVLSSLGEPLRAEIDIPEITPAEAESLRAQPASAEAFRAAGLEYDSQIASIRVSVQQRANGRPFLRLSSTRPVSDPFMDLIVEVSWASGRIARDYTMLFDPQGVRGSTSSAVASAPQITAPQIAVPPIAAPASAAAEPALMQAQGERDALRARALASVSSSRSQGTPDAVAVPQRRATAKTAAPAAVGAAAPLSAPAAAPSVTAGLGQVTVRAGDTAGRIAAAHLPPSVSLDQMLAAMLRANPQAFVNGNVNQLKSGAVLELPDPAKAAELTPEQTRQTLTAKSSDFNTFRRKLATAAPAASVAAAERSASGQLQAQVQDPKPASSAPDKLTLSKGSIDAAKPVGEARDATARTKELQKNIDELNKLRETSVAAVSATPGAQPAASPAGAAASARTDSSGTTAPAVAAPAAGTAPAAASGAVVPSSSPAITAAAAKPAPAAPAETGVIGQMLEQPLLPAMGLGLIALLAGFGIVRTRQRRRAEEEEKAFLAEANSGQSAPFYSVMGGQEVNTQMGRSHGSAVNYSPSQLDTGGEVDPVAEADVYLVYGREQEAVQTLTESLRADPSRLAVRTRLLEVLARRCDVSKFGALAAETRPLVGEQSADWQRISEMGRKLDSANALYRPLALSSASAGMFAAAGVNAMPDVDLTLDVVSPARATTQSSKSTALFNHTPPADEDSERGARGLDLDLSDFGSLQSLAGSQPPASATPLQRTAQASDDDSERNARGLDLDLSDFGSLRPLYGTRAAVEAPDTDSDLLPVGTSNWLAPTRPAPVQQPHAAPAASHTPGMIDFDFGALRLDLDEPAAERQPEFLDVAIADSYDESAESSTKLALAEAFTAIGDGAGARSLLQEVINESAGTVKAKAQRLLTTIQ